MGGLAVESGVFLTHTEDISVENGLNDSCKKKKRRPRRSRTSNSISACNSASEIFVDDSNEHHQEDNTFSSSISRIHLNEENEIQDLVRPEIVPVGLDLMAKRLQADYQSRQNYFPPHLSAEAVDKGLEKGELLRAVFRVNAHNKLEAYCKVDGVQTDVLISGAVAQNRSIEGDIVAIAIDHPSIWPRMKGFNETLNSSKDEALTHNQDNSKGKNILHPVYDYLDPNNQSLPQHNRTYYENGPSPESNLYNRHTNGGVLNNDSVISFEKFSSLVNLLPSKRPTGRVMAVIEDSIRRDNIVGLLSMQQWIYSRGSRKNDSRNSTPNLGHIILTPNDPKFTKMTVPFVNLPPIIKKRLESCDLSLESELVGVRIVDWSQGCHIPEARVVEIFGRGSDVKAQINSILFENGIDASDFSEEALSCLPSLPWKIPQEELKNRRDLRNSCVFTIDPSTATDLDDALSVENLASGDYRVGVHIADVSYFVLPDTGLDFDAQIRSTSVYLTEGKLPMLPPMLSDNLASLNPGVDRLAFSIFWDIGTTGQILNRWVGRTIMNSCSKLSYEHAQQILDGKFDYQLSNLPKLYGRFEWGDVINSVKTLHQISKILKENRFKSGALSFDNPKVAFLFDENGVPYDSIFSSRIDSNFLVEEFMLLANSTAAEIITRAYPSCALLRRHPEPNPRKLREFENFCAKHALNLDVSSPTSLRISLDQIKGEIKDDPELFDIVMNYATRPMQLASYFCSEDSDSDSDRCHYALAVPLYTHFTSPLRRYADIVVHRTLAAALEAEDNFSKVNKIRCFSGLCFEKGDLESKEAREALSAGAVKFGVPCAETVADVAAHCNEKKLATRHVKDASDKLYMWVLLKKKEILYSEARVLGLGPRFMSIYIPKLAIERRINYDEVDGLTVEWLESTSTLVLSQSACNKRSNRRNIPGKCRTLEEVAVIINPADSDQEMNFSGNYVEPQKSDMNIVPEPSFFPLTLHLLSRIPVALHAIGGDDGPLDIVARLYMSSYFQ